MVCASSFANDFNSSHVIALGLTGATTCKPLPPLVRTNDSMFTLAKHFSDFASTFDHRAPGRTVTGIQIEYQAIRLFQTLGERGPWMELDNIQLRQSDQARDVVDNP